MTNIVLKRSSVNGKVPSVGDLSLGEIGINTYDGKIFIKKDDGTESIIDIGKQGEWGSITGVLSSQSDLNSTLAGKQETLVSGTNIKTINGSTLLGSGDITVTAMVSGTSTEVQYRNGGSLGAAGNVKIDNNDLILGINSSPVTPASDNVKLFAKKVSGRMFPAMLGPLGMDAILQPSMWRQKIALWNPPGNGTSVPGVFGMTAPTAVGTATARTVATTNLFTRTRRLGYVSVFLSRIVSWALFNGRAVYNGKWSKSGWIFLFM